MHLRIHLYNQFLSPTRFQFSNSLWIMVFDFMHFSLVVFNSFISCIPSSCCLCMLSLSSPNLKSVNYEINLFLLHLLLNFQNHVFTFAFLKHQTSYCKIETPPFLHQNSMLDRNSNNVRLKQCLNEHNFHLNTRKLSIMHITYLVILQI